MVLTGAALMAHVRADQHREAYLIRYDTVPQGGLSTRLGACAAGLVEGVADFVGPAKAEEGRSTRDTLSALRCGSEPLRRYQNSEDAKLRDQAIEQLEPKSRRPGLAMRLGTVTSLRLMFTHLWVFSFHLDPEGQPCFDLPLPTLTHLDCSKLHLQPERQGQLPSGLGLMHDV
jgi:hypothetical protein